jgi:hypothetical protein
MPVLQDFYSLGKYTEDNLKNGQNNPKMMMTQIRIDVSSGLNNGVCPTI